MSTTLLVARSTNTPNFNPPHQRPNNHRSSFLGWLIGIGLIVLIFVVFGFWGEPGEETVAPAPEITPKAPVVLTEVTVPAEFLASIPAHISPDTPGASYSISDVYVDGQEGYMIFEAFGLRKHMFPGLEASCMVVKSGDGNTLLYLPVSGSGDTDGLVDENHTERVNFHAPIDGQYYFFYGCGSSSESTEVPLGEFEVPGARNLYNLASEAGSGYRMVVQGEHADRRKWWYIVSSPELGLSFPSTSCYYDDRSHVILGGTISFDSRLSNDILLGGFISEFVLAGSPPTSGSGTSDSYRVMWADPCPVF